MGFKYIMQQKFIWKIVNSQLAKYCLKFRIDEALYKSPSTLRTVYSSKFDDGINKNKLKPIIKEVPTHRYLINHKGINYEHYNVNNLIKCMLDYEMLNELKHFRNVNSIIKQLIEDEDIDKSIPEKIKNYNPAKTYNNNVSLDKIVSLMYNDNSFDQPYDIWMKAVFKYLYMAKNINANIDNLLHEWSKKSNRYDSTSLDNIINSFNRKN